MKNTFFKLYEKNSPAEEVYIIEDSTIIYYLSEYDKYQLKGKNFIIGCIELILQDNLNKDISRLETVISTKKSGIKKITKSNFIENLQNISFVYNIAQVIAKQNILIESIILENKTELIQTKITTQDASKEYYITLKNIENIYNQYRYPWIHEFIQKHQNSIAYKEGKIFVQNSFVHSNKFTEIEKNIFEYEKNSEITLQCNNENNLYLLKSGSIDIFINEEKAMNISQPETLICAEYFLTKSKPNKKLKTVTKSVIQKLNLSEIKSNINLLQQILNTLAKQYYKNIIELNKTNDRVIEQRFSPKKTNDSAIQKKHKIETELRELQSEFDSLVIENKAEHILINIKQ